MQSGNFLCKYTWNLVEEKNCGHVWQEYFPSCNHLDIVVCEARIWVTNIWNFWVKCGRKMHKKLWIFPLKFFNSLIVQLHSNSVACNFVTGSGKSREKTGKAIKTVRLMTCVFRNCVLGPQQENVHIPRSEHCPFLLKPVSHCAEELSGFTEAPPNLFRFLIDVRLQRSDDWSQLH